MAIEEMELMGQSRPEEEPTLVLEQLVIGGVLRTLTPEQQTRRNALKAYEAEQAAIQEYHKGVHDLVAGRRDTPECQKFLRSHNQA